MLWDYRGCEVIPEAAKDQSAKMQLADGLSGLSTF